jgi:DNA repair exonuclease SbcCD nuclease subunit
MSKEIKVVAHLADIHIRTYRYHKEYKEVFVRLIESLTYTLSNYAHDEARIVIAGDLFHQKITVSNEQTILASWFLKELANIAPVILIAGNHDLLENNKSRLDSISPIIELLGEPKINYLMESKCYEDNNIVWCNYSIFEENKRPDIEEARKKYTNHKFVGLFHAPVIGAKTDIGFEFETGESPEHFEGCDFALLGDIHKFQEINVSGVKAVYPGSLIQQDFGESIHNHGYLLWEVESGGYQMYEVDNDYLNLTFKISSIDDLENDKEILVNG